MLFYELIKIANKINIGKKHLQSLGFHLQEEIVSSYGLEELAIIDQTESEETK